MAIGVLTVASSSLPAQPVSGGLKLWLKADAITGLADGANVGTWVDSSGNGLDLNPSGAPPTWHAAVLNGQPVVRFAGNNAMSKTGVSGASFTSSDQATVFVVMLQNSADVFNSAYGWGDGSNRFVLHATFDDLLSFQHGVSGGTGGVVQPGSWDNLYHLLEMYRSVSQAEIMIDGVVSFQTSPPGGTLNTSAISIFFLGTDQFGNTLTGDIAELLVYNRVLAIEERCQVAAYLGSKYGLPYGVGRCDCNNNGRPDGQDVHVADGGPCTTPPDPLPAFCTMQPAAPECNCSDDCNLNGVPDECEPDCNDNGVPDSCEPNEEDRDCNGDGVCNGVQIAGCPPNTPSCADCNANGIQNSCEIATGAPDCNANGIPDECDSFQQIVYVNASATGANNGETWADAFVHLQSALALASSCGTAQQIWVARGTYMSDGGYTKFGDPPSSHIPGTGSQSDSFILIDGVAIYGGFAGGEVLLSDRNIAANPTILSGDLAANDGLQGFTFFGENSRHVVFAQNNSASSVLDGFFIERANLNGGPGDDSRGGGIINKLGSPTISNCVIRLCLGSAGSSGAGLYNSGTMTLTACAFIGNITGQGGGGMFNDVGSEATLTGCDFDGNTAAGGGGISSNAAISIILTGCTFESNTGSSSGAAVSNVNVGTFSATDCVFFNNHPNNSNAGGIYAGSVGSFSLLRCDFRQNTNGFNFGQAGALWLDGTSGTITDCLFEGNQVPGTGGAVRLDSSSSLFERCTFRSNGASSGGGVSAGNSASAFTMCTFSGNLAYVGGLGAGVGGAILAGGGGQSSVTVTNCDFVGNVASGNVVGHGGAISVEPNVNVTAVNSRFRQNQAGGSGKGGAIQNSGNSTVINCTFSGNAAFVAGGIYTINDMTITNCILWANSQNGGTLESAQILNDESGGLNNVAVNRTCVQGLTGNLGGVGNIGGDPLFMDPDGADNVAGTIDDDLRLLSGSPCIDAGDNTAVPPDTEDLDNDANTTEPIPLDLAFPPTSYPNPLNPSNPRFFNDPFVTPDTGSGTAPIVDMGAYELIRLDCNNNSIPDECDVSCANQSGQCGVLYPQACGLKPDCNADGLPDDCQVPPLCPTCPDCDSDGIPDECQLAGSVNSRWAATTQPHNWNRSANWCQPLVPTNGIPIGNTYSVSIPGSTPICTLDISPTISSLELLSDGTLEVNDDSGANVRTLAVDGMIVNNGVLRATDRERLVIDAPLIDQLDVNPDCITRAGGLLEATDGVFNDPSNPDSPTAKSILEINGSVVLGGRARTIGSNSEIHLIGGAELVDVCVEGVIVPDGQAGAFAGTIVNSGRLGIAPTGAAFAILSPMGINEMLEGDGGGDDSVTLGGQTAARLGDFKAAFTNAANHRIDGAGIIFGGMTNLGVVDANFADAQHLIIFPPGLKVNDGMMQATNGGVLRIADDITGIGNIVAMGGRVIVVPGVTVLCDDIDVPPGSISHLDIGVSPPGAATVTASAMNITGGIVNIAGESVVTLEGAATVCPAASPPGSMAELHLNGATLNAGNLDICDGGVLTVASSINLSGSFANAMTDGTASPVPIHWSWGTGSILSMAGGQSPDLTAGSLVGWAKLEAASDDAGPSGGTNNFSFANIVLTAGAHVSLVDFNTNGTSGQGEAVYCENLNLGSGSVLNLNGLSLYRSQPTPQQVTPGPLDGGTVIDEPRGISGDCSGDGVMNEADLECFVEVLLELDTNPAHVLLTDLNSDGFVDGRDVQVFVTNALGG